ncbi:MAG: hypothetical protein QNJ55_23225 [Xenococcus sp. MO_188.B8]|nr:hypothetical protein [Xenococcus sp. MO_188.B8]
MAYKRHLAMHEAVFEAGWQYQKLRKEHRNKIGAIHRLYTLTREALHNLLELTQNLLAQGKSTEQVLEVIMPE